MSQSPARAARRECARRGHALKTDGQGRWMCARCLAPIDVPAGQDAQTPGPEVTHLAVIQASLPPGLAEVAGGTETHCRTELERWVAERGLRDGERALIVAVVAETVVEPGVGVYTVPAGPQ